MPLSIDPGLSDIHGAWHTVCVRLLAPVPAKARAL